MRSRLHLQSQALANRLALITGQRAAFLVATDLPVWLSLCLYRRGLHTPIRYRREAGIEPARPEDAVFCPWYQRQAKYTTGAIFRSLNMMNPQL